jgi:hypothetical protein
MTPPIRIVDDYFYPEETLRLQGLDGDALRRARKEGKLLYKKVGSQVLIKGEWLREWLDRPEDVKGGGTSP